jgi:hypothetical protein
MKRDMELVSQILLQIEARKDLKPAPVTLDSADAVRLCGNPPTPACGLT